MSRKLRILLLFVSVVLALVPAAAFARDDDDGDLLLRINGPITVGPAETHENVIVISDDLTMEGTVTSTVFVIDGDAVVTGKVEGDITVISGRLTLGSTATVDNVNVIDGTLVRENGAVISGKLSQRDDLLNIWQVGVFSALVWIGMVAVVLAGGLIFAGVAGRQLSAAGDRIAREPGPTVLAALVAWVAMPVLMVLTMFTLVGIPMGIGYFVFVLPVLWFAGYLVAGTQLGRLMLRNRPVSERPYLAAVVGLIILQAVTWIPWFGGVVAFVAGVVGSGALLLLAWQSWRGQRTEKAHQPGTIVTPVPST